MRRQPRCCSREAEFGAADEDEPHDARPLRAERQPDGHFPRAQGARKGDDAIDAEQSQQESGAGKNEPQQTSWHCHSQVGGHTRYTRHRNVRSAADTIAS